MDKALANNIGTAARHARLALNLTQEEAAERIGVSVEFYARIERCRSLPSVRTLIRMANTLDLSVDVMLGNASLNEVGGLFSGVKPPAVRVRRRRPRPEPEAVVSEERTEGHGAQSQSQSQGEAA